MAKAIGLVANTNPDILTVLRSESEVLARIKDDFHTMLMTRVDKHLSPIAITCFYEELPLPIVGEVGSCDLFFSDLQANN